MKKLMLVLALLAIGSAAQAALVAQYSFESNLTDTAAGGTAADNLVGMAMYPPNGQYAPTAYQNPPVYEAGISGQAARIGATGTYTYLEGHEDHYPWADGYNPLTITGASYLSTTADSVDLDLQSGSFTMEGFFKADVLGEYAYTRLLTKWVGGGFTQNYHLTIHSGKLEIIQKNSSGTAVTIASTNAIAAVTGEWFYVAAVGNGSSIGLYLYTKDINGNVVGGLIGSGAYNGTMYNSSSPFWIGGREDIFNPITDNNGFKGLVDEVRVWDEAVSTAYLLERANMIPEPATMAILALGGLLLRRKK